MTDIGEVIRNHFAVAFLVIALLCAVADIILFRTAIAEAVLAYILLVNIGWKTKSPFQKEVAAADAAFGVLGVLSFFIRDNFLVATVIGASIMLFFMGIGHVLDLKKSKNLSPYNAGSVVYFDLLIPVAMIVLLVLWKTG
jgi:hypothetical protein